MESRHHEENCPELGGSFHGITPRSYAYAIDEFPPLERLHTYERRT